MTLNSADEGFAAQLRAKLPEAVLRPVAPRYLQEPRGLYRGQAGVLALPRSAQEVAILIATATAARVGVVPFGGGTGLVGGQIAPDGPAPLLISLERMTAVRSVHPQENVLIAEAGTILADVQAAARGVGRFFPLSLASEGSARIGGNLSTNAGGVNVLRYGNARDLCLGLEAVLPDGRIWNGLTRLRKDNTGYDLRNLLIGAEGTLGIITAAALKLAPIPAGEGTALIVVPSPEAALKLLTLARDRLGETVSAFELMHRQGLEFLAEELPDLRQPFASPPEWCVLIEIGVAAGLDPQAALAGLFESAQQLDLASDGVIAQSAAQRDALWAVREQIPEANRRVGSVSSHDISVPLGVLPEFIARAGAAIAGIGAFRINCFGHLGDGNLHYNVFPLRGHDRADYTQYGARIRQVIHDLVASLGGSFSAEHGIGRLKVADLEHYGDPVKLSAMRAIKAALDPHGIMNPGAVLRG
ncbi:FAD-binding oxidoreductase [Sedimentitalea nanhaiensis]|uniref:FAD/FMN-containing dehydrogenase n=1 Tax=Sedimentitalea nanhaiensis TaxID=999627 RepID=A0A1I7AZ63_9RHOB|nr:FAD-binding oxidoreductase [Sedimentitalea nanhaiensis]SFT80193.1 FAD/FMN-containing dehydrogenase [Sedimentitalea nanhaiensis]